MFLCSLKARAFGGIFDFGWFVLYYVDSGFISMFVSPTQPSIPNSTKSFDFYQERREEEEEEI